MIFTFVLGALAGFATPYMEPHVRAAMEQVALAKIPISETEFDLLTLVLLLLVAAVLTGGGSSLALLAGALLGVFGKRIVALAKGENRE
ncbi:hypothetical protein KUL25_02035 [Rhodobacteraceae bacterium N5(2021)]|uniref:Uncharacterized protein n=1 Tax=Gymnodinialimonas phycosphaerae TaxID=2841589 RepID=A0A975YGD1_9RHOB|nr:hypothetical protein [Gymnodinialimonas phycosphaerae]MBY4891541.1 hypothetical protein [Gymnodinialimonas phycosphaerae]